MNKKVRTALLVLLGLATWAALMAGMALLVDAVKVLQ